MFDITAMLGNSGSDSNNNVSSSFNFTDYAAIKNGSYGKLVKSYYSGTTKSIDEQKAATARSSSSVSSKKAAADTDKTGLAQIKADADRLKASAEKLGSNDLWKKTGGKEDAAAITGAVKDFVADYNKVIDQASKVGSKEISRDVQFMTGMTDTFSKVLGKIGVNVEAGGKLSVDEQALNKADLATVRSVFSGSGTYGSQIADRAGSVYRDADMSTSIYGSDATTSSALTGMYNQFI